MRTTLRARRPYARAVFGPVRRLLGGRASPAAFLGFVGIVLPRGEGGGDHDQEGGKRPRCLLMAGWAKQSLLFLGRFLLLGHQRAGGPLAQILDFLPEFLPLLALGFG